MDDSRQDKNLLQRPSLKPQQLSIHQEQQKKEIEATDIISESSDGDDYWEPEKEIIVEEIINYKRHRYSIEKQSVDELFPGQNSDKKNNPSQFQKEIQQQQSQQQFNQGSIIQINVSNVPSLTNLNHTPKNISNLQIPLSPSNKSIDSGENTEKNNGQTNEQPQNFQEYVSIFTNSNNKKLSVNDENIDMSPAKKKNSGLFDKAEGYNSPCHKSRATHRKKNSWSIEHAIKQQKLTGFQELISRLRQKRLFGEVKYKKPIFNVAKDGEVRRGGFIDEYLITQAKELRFQETILKKKVDIRNVEEGDVFIKVLTKQEKTQKEMLFLQRGILGLDMFKTGNSQLAAKMAEISQNIYQLNKLVKGLRHKQYKKRDVIFNAGEVGTTYFIVISGMVDCLVPTSKKSEIPKDVMKRTKKMNEEQLKDLDDKLYYHLKFPNYKQVFTFMPGQGFGDIALLTQSKRTATMVVREDSHLLALTKQAFEKIFEQTTKSTFLSKQLDFLNNFPFFASIASSYLISGLVKYQKILSYNNKDIIFSEKDVAENYYFIKDGEISLSQMVELDSEELQKETKMIEKTSLCISKIKKMKQKRVTFTNLSKNMYFGEYEIYNQMPKRVTKAVVHSNYAILYQIQKDKLNGFLKSVKKFDNFQEHIKEKLKRHEQQLQKYKETFTQNLPIVDKAKLIIQNTEGEIIQPSKIAEKNIKNSKKITRKSLLKNHFEYISQDPALQNRSKSPTQNLHKTPKNKNIKKKNIQGQDESPKFQDNFNNSQSISSVMKNTNINKRKTMKNGKLKNTLNDLQIKFKKQDILEKLDDQEIKTERESQKYKNIMFSMPRQIESVVQAQIEQQQKVKFAPSNEYFQQMEEDEDPERQLQFIKSIDFKMMHENPRIIRKLLCNSVCKFWFEEDDDFIQGEEKKPVASQSLDTKAQKLQYAKTYNLQRKKSDGNPLKPLTKISSFAGGLSKQDSNHSQSYQEVSPRKNEQYYKGVSPKKQPSNESNRSDQDFKHLLKKLHLKTSLKKKVSMPQYFNSDQKLYNMEETYYQEKKNQQQQQNNNTLQHAETDRNMMSNTSFRIKKQNSNPPFMQINKFKNNNSINNSSKNLQKQKLKQVTLQTEFKEDQQQQDKEENTYINNIASFDDDQQQQGDEEQIYYLPSLQKINDKQLYDRFYTPKSQKLDSTTLIYSPNTCKNNKNNNSNSQNFPSHFNFLMENSLYPSKKQQQQQQENNLKKIDLSSFYEYKSQKKLQKTLHNFNSKTTTHKEKSFENDLATSQYFTDRSYDQPTSLTSIGYKKYSNNSNSALLTENDLQYQKENRNSLKSDRKNSTKTNQKNNSQKDNHTSGFYPLIKSKSEKIQLRNNIILKKHVSNNNPGTHSTHRKLIKKQDVTINSQNDLQNNLKLNNSKNIFSEQQLQQSN